MLRTALFDIVATMEFMVLGYPASLSSNSFTNNVLHGVYLSGINTLSSSGNMFANNAQRGLYATGIVSGSVTNSTFTNNGDYAAYLNFTNGELIASNGNNSTGNSKGVILLNGTLSGTTTLSPNATLPYSFDSNLAVNSGATLTLQAGVIFKPVFSSQTTLNVYGTLNAQGSVASPVVITSLKDDSVGGDSNNDGGATFPAGNDWGTIQVFSGGIINLDYTMVRYGGYNNWYVCCAYANLGVNGGSLLISNSTISNSGYDGIRSFAGGGSLTISNSIIQNNAGLGINYPSAGSVSIANTAFHANGSNGMTISASPSLSLSGNTFTNNGGYAAYLSLISNTTLSLENNTGSGNTKNGISLAGTLGKNTTLPPSPGFPYILADFTVGSNTTLTILSGNIIKLENLANITINGTLLSQGSLGVPVYFTSIKDDSVGGDTNKDGASSSPSNGDWWKIDIYGSATLDYTTVSYGGNDPYAPIGDDAANLLIRNTSSVIISNSVISNARYFGIRQYGAAGKSLIVNNSKFEKNGSDGLLTENVPTISLDNNQFLENGAKGVNISSTRP